MAFWLVIMWMLAQAHESVDLWWGVTRVCWADMFQWQSHVVGACCRRYEANRCSGLYSGSWYCDRSCALYFLFLSVTKADYLVKLITRWEMHLDESSSTTACGCEFCRNLGHLVQQLVGKVRIVMFVEALLCEEAVISHCCFTRYVGTGLLLSSFVCERCDEVPTVLKTSILIWVEAIQFVEMLVHLWSNNFGCWWRHRYRKLMAFVLVIENAFDNGLDCSPWTLFHNWYLRWMFSAWFGKDYSHETPVTVARIPPVAVD